MLMVMPTPSTANIRAALEDLRTADRILMSVQGTTKFLRRQQFADGFGMPTADGYFGDVTVRDNQHANDELLVAQQAMTDATRRLGLVDASSEPETLKVWGRLEDIFDGAWSDFIASRHARNNQQVAARVRSRVRALFARTCELHPEAAAGVEPLTSDTIVDDDLRPQREWVKIALVTAYAIFMIAAYIL